MFFSIIIPVYNSQDYIKNCITSVKNQTSTDFECILINDGSTDDSKRSIQDLIKDDLRFKLINKKNGGVSSARNEGLNNASGEYVIFIDADDYAEPDLLETVKSNCDGKDIIQYDFYKCIDSDTKKEIHINSNLNLILAGEGAVVWKRAFRKDFIKDIQFDETLKGGEDYLFCCEAFLKKPEYKYINKCLYNYTTSNIQSAMNSNSIDTLIDQFKATQKVEVILKNNNLFDEYKADINERYFWCLSEFNNWYLGTRNKRTFIKRVLLKVIKIILKRF